MKFCKIINILATFMLVALGLLPTAQAALTGFHRSRNPETATDHVSFYLYDLDNSRNAVLSADTLSFIRSDNGPIAPSLEYSINNSDWAGFNGPLTIDYGDAALVRISFRLDPKENNSKVQLLPAGAITFQGYDAANSEKEDLDLFHALYVVWDFHHHPAVTFSSADDPVTPNAPIPASALLLFTGLIGIIGFRRRMNNS